MLGEVYMQLEIASRDQGQFFTPYSVCQLMAAMQVRMPPSSCIRCPS